MKLLSSYKAIIISVVGLLVVSSGMPVEAALRKLPRPQITYDIPDTLETPAEEEKEEKEDNTTPAYIASQNATPTRNYPVDKSMPDEVLDRDGKIDIHVTDISVMDLLNTVANRLHKKIMFGSDFPQRITFQADNMTMEELLNLLAVQAGINWSVDKDVYIIANNSQPFSPQFCPVRYADLNKLKSTFAALGLGGRIVANDYPRGLLVNGTANELRNVTSMINQLDKPEPSIRVEFVVVEINKNEEKKIGINWDDFSAGYRYGDSRQYGMGTVPKKMFNINKSLTAGITSMLLSGKSSGKILARPYIITANNEKARLSTGDEVPIFTKDYNGNPAVNYKKVGIELIVTPQIVNMKEDILSIRSKTTVNIISGQQTQQGLTAPQISSREAEDVLNVRSGEVVVIGGLIKEEDIATTSGIPVLKDIPLLGKLFQTKSRTKNFTDILIFIKPTVIKDSIINGVKAAEFNPWGQAEQQKKGIK